MKMKMNFKLKVHDDPDRYKDKSFIPHEGSLAATNSAKNTTAEVVAAPTESAVILEFVPNKEEEKRSFVDVIKNLASIKNPNETINFIKPPVEESKKQSAESNCLDGILA